MIKTVGGINEVLQNYKANEWASNKVDKSHSFELDSDLSIPLKEDKQQSFADFLAKSVSDANQLQVDANKAVEKLASGQTQNLHETLLAVEHADIAFRTLNQVRMKVLDAYKEVMRMQV